MSISSIGSSSAMMQSTYNIKRPDPAQMAAKLFAELDTSGQGYLTEADLQTAIDQISSSSSTTLSASDLLSKLDGDGDGKVTQQEFTDSLQAVAEADHQAQGSMSGMPPPPPPPPGGDTGLTQEQLTVAAKDTSSSDSAASSTLTDLANNFDAADTNGDGKVSFIEALTYELKTATSASSSSASTDTVSTSSSDQNAQVLSQIKKLMQVYGIGHAASSTLSVTA